MTQEGGTISEKKRDDRNDDPVVLPPKLFVITSVPAGHLSPLRLRLSSSASMRIHHTAE